MEIPTTAVNPKTKSDFPVPAGYPRIREKIKKPKKPRPQQLARNSLTYHGRFRPVPGEMSSDMISTLLELKPVERFLNKGPVKDRSRLTALLYTLYTADKVGTMMCLTPSQVRNCYNKHQVELQSAMQARNAMIAGMAERRAIEALQNLDVTKIPDERKPRAVKDLMDSAVLANQNIKPPEKDSEETTYELIYRIKNRGKQAITQPSNDNDDDVIEGEIVEESQIQEKTTHENTNGNSLLQ
jgi:hypothetical protein